MCSYSGRPVFALVSSSPLISQIQSSIVEFSVRGSKPLHLCVRQFSLYPLIIPALLPLYKVALIALWEFDIPLLFDGKKVLHVAVWNHDSAP